MERLAKVYQNLLCQDYKLEKEFDISEVGLMVAGSGLSSRQQMETKQN